MADLQFRSEKKYPLLKFYIILLWALGVFIWLVAGGVFLMMIEDGSFPDKAGEWVFLGTSLVLG